MWTGEICKKILISILTLLILVIYYSTYRHPYDIKLALTHHSYHKTPYHYFNTFSEKKNYNLTSNHTQIFNNLSQKTHHFSNELTHIFNITNIPINLLHFELLELKHHNKKCSEINQYLENSFLLINTNTKEIGLKYMKLIKSLVSKGKYEKVEGDKCINLRIFLLREKNILLMDSEESIEGYTKEISRGIKKVGELTSKKLSIMTTESGSALLLKTIIDMIDMGEFKSGIYKKMDKLVLINMYNGNMIKREPISWYLDELKSDIIYSKEKLKIFNSLNFIFINTEEKQYRLLGKINILQKKELSNTQIISTTEDNQLYEEDEQQHLYNTHISDHFFVFEKDRHWTLPTENGIELLERGEESEQQSTLKSKNKNQLSQNYLISSKYFSLQNTTILHTMEMSNIHASFIDGDYFHYLPFLELLSNFFIQNTQSPMNLKAVEYYFRYGETQSKAPLEEFAEIDLNTCVLYYINITEPTLWMNNKTCFRLNLETSLPDSVYLLYSDKGQFNMYTESMIIIAPFDKELNKSLYLFEKLEQTVIVYNPKNVKIILAIGQIFSPSNPLTKLFTHSEILYLNQIQPNLNQENHLNKKFIVRTCQSENLLVFPDNFPIGKISREFLLKESHESCYDEDNSYKRFMDKLTENWTVLRNIIVLILFKKSFFNCKYPLRDIIYTFLSISLLLYFTELKGYHNILIMFVVYIIDQAIQLVCQLGEYIQIDRNKVFVSMIILFTVSYVCQSFLFQHYNYWKMELIFLIFFLNKDNAYIITIKLFYLQDTILYEHEDFVEIVQLALFMYLTRTIKDKKEILYDNSSEVTKFSILMGLAFFTIFYPETDSFNSVFNFCIKSKLIFVFLQEIFLSKEEKEKLKNEIVNEE